MMAAPFLLFGTAGFVLWRKTVKARASRAAPMGDEGFEPPTDRV